MCEANLEVQEDFEFWIKHFVRGSQVNHRLLGELLVIDLRAESLTAHGLEMIEKKYKDVSGEFQEIEIGVWKKRQS